MKPTSRAAAFTFPELMIAMGIGSAMIAGLLVGSLALQRGYAAAEHQLRSQIEQMRIMDYITRDLRRAFAVSTANQNRKLIVTLPDQRDALADTLREPSLVSGKVRYGTNALTVSYFVEGNAFIREENGVKTVIASRRIDEFFAYTNALPLVRFELAFTPQFSGRSSPASTAGTRLETRVYVRNNTATVAW